MFQFQHTEYLWALAAVPVIVFLYLRLLAWKKKTITKIGDERLVRQLIKDYSPSKFSLKFILIVIAFTAGVIALANPRKQEGNTDVKRNGIDIMIALDVSKSMLAQDVSPTRLDRARQFISKLIDKMPENRVGLVIFAGRAYLQMPLTSDHHAAKLYLSSATPDAVPAQGTVINDALRMCYAAFNQKERKYKSIVLISDGEDHDEGAIKTAKQLAEEGVMINTIGIGSVGGTLLKDPATNDYKRDAEGNPVITKLNEEELKNIAVSGNGLYAAFSNADELITKLKKQFSSMEQRTITEKSSASYQNYFFIFLLIALVLLVWEFFTSEKKLTIETVSPAMLLMVLFFAPASLFAQNSNSLIKQGNKSYNKGQFTEASQQYKTASEEDTTNTKAQYNLGNALYKSGNADSAMMAYDNAIKNSKTVKEKAEAWYNKGVVLQNKKKLAECIEAYKNSLRLDPTDEDARLNLQKALQQQKQEQKKKNQQNKEKDPKENKDKKNEQKKNDEEKKDQPKPAASKMTKKEAEENLKSLLQREQNLQDKLRKVQPASSQKEEKDW